MLLKLLLSSIEENTTLVAFLMLCLLRIPLTVSPKVWVTYFPLGKGEWNQFDYWSGWRLLESGVTEVPLWKRGSEDSSIKVQIVRGIRTARTTELISNWKDDEFGQTIFSDKFLRSLVRKIYHWNCRPEYWFTCMTSDISFKVPISRISGFKVSVSIRIRNSCSPKWLMSLWKNPNLFWFSFGS